MKIIDISRPLNADTAVYKNYDSKRFHLEAVSVFADNGVHESDMKTNLHTGTHVDAPKHMVENGGDLDSLDLAHFIGPCRVFDLTKVTDAIRLDDIRDLDIDPSEIVLFKTRNSFDEGFNFEFVYLEEDAAEYLVDLGVKTVGLDAMSIERAKAGHEVHLILLGNGVAIIEDIRLADVAAGKYFLSALPLRITGAEASPVRAVLIED